jgi:hypothetical protein
MPVSRPPSIVRSSRHYLQLEIGSRGENVKQLGLICGQRLGAGFVRTQMLTGTPILRVA